MIRPVARAVASAAHRRRDGRRGARRDGRRNQREISCDIAALGSLYLGGVDARDLAAAGRVRASSPELLRAFALSWQAQNHPATGTDF